MLKTAFKLKWILALLAALALATGFVALSGWQFGASESEPIVKADKTEVPVPLTEHVTVGQELLGIKADQIVTFSGHFVHGADVLVAPRLQDGVKGAWVVSEFVVDGAPQHAAMAVVRGWQQDQAAAPGTAPEGELEITGRLLPPEGPIDRHDVRAPALQSLSSAQLANTWDTVLYSGFVTAHQMNTAKGAAVEQAGLTPVITGPQPQEAQVNWLNVFYGIEWVVFAAFALFLWYRMVRDDYQRNMDQIAAQAAARRAAESAPDRQAPNDAD